ncbi:MAG: hypothetical protein HOC71_15595 [Candidatus Latescibacteria bacterium]|jgi:mannose/fructose-specific phosphotransferase system component IIA|nr:hypothetical protein [Candidatus Latescibacterota bacterium]
MIYGLLVGHRDIGEGILRALKSISGGIENFSCISNDGLSTNELVEKIIAFSDDHKGEGLLIFVDLYGGSCWRASKKAKLKSTHIISGANLPMLLSFINKRESFSLDDLPVIIENDGKRGITLD